jgi:hypothetical protein
VRRQGGKGAGRGKGGEQGLADESGFHRGGTPVFGSFIAALPWYQYVLAVATHVSRYDKAGGWQYLLTVWWRCVLFC